MTDAARSRVDLALGYLWPLPFHSGLAARRIRDGVTEYGDFSLMTTAIRNVLMDEQGQGLAEGGLILGLIAVACIAPVVFLSGTIQGILSNVGSGPCN